MDTARPAASAPPCEPAAADDTARDDRPGPPDALPEALGALTRTARRCVEIESLRLRAKVDRGVTAAVGGGALALLAVAALLTAGVQLVLGLSAGLASLAPDAPWLGPLVTGLAVPGALLALLSLSRARRSRKRVARARELAAEPVAPVDHAPHGA